LNTRDRKEAENLKDQLNELLKEQRYHDAAARAEAERRFNPLVVDIFFDKMIPEEFDYTNLRDEVIPLPESAADGYRSVLLLGTTGAGKTTLVRQLIGTDPFSERFPSTSTAKTTVHDTEILMDDGNWRAVVTFVSSDEAREYLTECISAAALAASKGANDASILTKLLSHVNQRFRFNYILGNGPALEASDFDDEEDEGDDGEENGGLFGDEEQSQIDLNATNEVLTQALTTLKQTTSRLSEGLRKEMAASGEYDERVIDELFEEKLDDLLQGDDAFHEIADALMDEIEKRFDLLPEGKVTRTKQGWPRRWRGEWPPDERQEFLKAIAPFSSNYAPLFGRLLTPLVNGVRVAGPFAPSWNGRKIPQLVLLDGEGMGHTPNSSSAVSTTVSKRIELADAVLLVDSATQPMQAAPLAAIRELVATGNARKLILAFTHFDEVQGDNLPTLSSKVQHVLASAENVLASFGEELGSYAERALRNRLEQARFFLANLHRPLVLDKSTDRRTVQQLVKLVEAIESVIEKPELAVARPVYDRTNLVLVISGAAEGFHAGWLPRLGLKNIPGIAKEHWTRIKALTRRLATGMADEYDTLKPVADLRTELRDRIYVFVQNPVRWEGPEPTDDQRQTTYDSLADNISRRLLGLASRRLWRQRTREWQTAYDKRGTGSSFVRARIIDQDIYEAAASVPDITASPDRNQFLREVVAEVEGAIAEVNAKLV
jgi:energy-coupling factor transporter ATP-binding protein EcfA2